MSSDETQDKTPPNRKIPRKRVASDELNQRQEIFARFVALGDPASVAYKKAGYNSAGKGAESHSVRLASKGKIKARIDQIIADELVAAKALARMTKADKLAILEAMARNEAVRANDRINAIKTHNDMTGDNEPTRQIIDSGENMLAAIRDRARQISSPLQRL
jgi:phage terminase small subunit